MNFQNTDGAARFKHAEGDKHPARSEGSLLAQLQLKGEPKGGSNMILAIFHSDFST